MDIDEHKSPVLYFGTTTGQLCIERDGGEEWNCLFDALPPYPLCKSPRSVTTAFSWSISVPLGRA
jgi:hypothetical protein